MEVKDFIVFGKPDISEAEEKAVVSVLRSGWLGNGPVSRQFEDKFVDYLGADVYGVALNSCTMGIYLALRAEGIGLGDQVITSPLTFAATINAILMVGAEPIFVDVDPMGRINADLIPDAINEKTKAIIPVHLWGVPCQMSRIMALAREKNLVVIEDAAHGFGGSFYDDKLGTIGDYGVFSFYPTKNICCGDGGIVVTNRKEKADLIRVLASQGLSDSAWMRYGSGKIKDYSVEHVGFKGLMNDIQAAILNAQLDRWPEIQGKRKAIWEVYSRAFPESYWNQSMGHSNHLFTLKVNNRDDFREKMHEQGVGTGIHYKPLHLEPGYQFLNQSDFPMAEAIGRLTVSLPVSSTMNLEDAMKVVGSVGNSIKGSLNGISGN